jgi:hypothetical protein
MHSKRFACLTVLMAPICEQVASAILVFLLSFSVQCTKEVAIEPSPIAGATRDVAAPNAADRKHSGQLVSSQDKELWQATRLHDWYSRDIQQLGPAARDARCGTV